MLVFDVFAPDMNPILSRMYSVTRNKFMAAAVMLGVIDLAATGYFAWLKRYGVATITAAVGIGLVLYLLRRGLRRVVNDCLDLQLAAIRQFQPDVCVGSSWGGAMLCFAIVRGYWRGPSLLLAPAQTKVNRYAGFSEFPPYFRIPATATSAPAAATVATVALAATAAAAGAAAVSADSIAASSSSHSHSPLPVIHGLNDTTIPLHDSEAVFGNWPNATLETVNDDHRLHTFLTAALYKNRIERLWKLHNRKERA